MGLCKRSNQDRDGLVLPRHRAGCIGTHIWFGRSVVIVPPWTRGPTMHDTQLRAKRPACRMSCNTDGFDVRITSARNRTQTFRCHSLRKGEASSTCRM